MSGGGFIFNGASMPRSPGGVESGAALSPSQRLVSSPAATREAARVAKHHMTSPGSPHPPRRSPLRSPPSPVAVHRRALAQPLARNGAGGLQAGSGAGGGAGSGAGGGAALAEAGGAGGSVGAGGGIGASSAAAVVLSARSRGSSAGSRRRGRGSSAGSHRKNSRGSSAGSGIHAVRRARMGRGKTKTKSAGMGDPDSRFWDGVDHLLARPPPSYVCVGG